MSQCYIKPKRVGPAEMPGEQTWTRGGQLIDKRVVGLETCDSGDLRLKQAKKKPNSFYRVGPRNNEN